MVSSVVGMSLCCLFLFVVDVFCLCIIVAAFRCVEFVLSLVCCLAVLFLLFTLGLCFVVSICVDLCWLLFID